MKKILLMCISILLLTGCGKVDKDDLVSSFKEKVESSKAYEINSKMEIYNAEDTFSYDIKVYYMDDDYFKVEMVNTLSEHEQVILRNDDEVYVVTPSLNKSYKFVSEWPYNSSQSYILNTLVKDIDDSKEVGFEENDDGFILTVDVNYPNNSNLSYEKIYFDKKKNLKKVDVYDKDDIVAISVSFNKIDYKANLKEEDFDINKMIEENCCNTDDENNEINDSNNEESSSENQETGSVLEDIIYPLYVPANTFLKNKEIVNTEVGERAILTFNGDKNFVLIEEALQVNDEFEIIPVYGDPLMLSNTIGALSTNSLSWNVDNVSYYLASNDLSTAEILSIADSLNTTNIVEEK
ncbi:MAG TPA: outer membrane lipoprotein carrier protein LolA [Candidatus Coprovivens excrementavium]|nr:outer membrane lipoprotein carrier protein LolA [Candidatus Coprovivens excrementavium]